jgi:hypothetical protein
MEGDEAAPPPGRRRSLSVPNLKAPVKSRSSSPSKAPSLPTIDEHRVSRSTPPATPQSTHDESASSSLSRRVKAATSLSPAQQQQKQQQRKQQDLATGLSQDTDGTRELPGKPILVAGIPFERRHLKLAAYAFGAWLCAVCLLWVASSREATAAFFRDFPQLFTVYSCTAVGFAFAVVLDILGLVYATSTAKQQLATALTFVNGLVMCTYIVLVNFPLYFPHDTLGDPVMLIRFCGTNSALAPCSHRPSTGSALPSHSSHPCHCTL